MKKYWFLLMLYIVAFSPLAAQNRATSSFSVGAELNIPQRSAYNFGYGASGKLEIPVASAVSLNITGGYHRFSYKSFAIGGYSKPDADSFVPLKGGVKYYIDERFYTEGELGTVLNNNSQNSGNLFTYSLGTGFLLPLGERKSNMLDIGLRFEDWSKNRLQQFAIRVAYRLGF
jgi:hypothetical protein